VRWRTPDDGIPPAAQFLSSPHDSAAHFSKKGSTCWVGDKVALTETCAEETPNLITYAEPTSAPPADGKMTPKVHRDLQQRDLLPAIQPVDTGFLDAALLVESRRDDRLQLLGPTSRAQRWQARAAERFGMADFVVDFDRCRASCPEGQERLAWVLRVDNRGTDSIYIRFSPADCGPCPSRVKCTRSQAKHPRRSIAVRPQPQYDALQTRRNFQESPEHKREYARRAGIEGTISQGTRRCGLRRSRYAGLARTHLGHGLTAEALTFVWVADWLAGTERSRTRPPRFAMLMAPA
jgi:transposase